MVEKEIKMINSFKGQITAGADYIWEQLRTFWFNIVGIWQK